MPDYRYKARQNDGTLITGHLEADSAHAAAQVLSNRGLIPVHIETAVVEQDLLEQFNAWQALRTLGINDLILFSRQMYGLTKAGVPLTRALASLAESCRNLAMKQALLDISQQLASGRSMSQAMSQYPKIFPILMVSIINVGEATGNLEQAFLQISHYMEREKHTSTQVKSALRYPTMVIIAIAIAMIIVNIYVIPAFKGVFEKIGAELPWQTKLLLSISDFVVSHGLHLLGGLAAIIVIAAKYLQSPGGLENWHRLQLRIPAIGNIIEQATMERFARSFAMVLASGVPLLQGISIVSQAVGNVYIGNKLYRMRIGIEKGDSISRMARSIGLFPPLVVQMIIVGEESGNIAEMLQHVAEFYEGEIDQSIKNLSSVIEPFLIVIIGIMVLILALGIFLPIWNLSTSLQH